MFSLNTYRLTWVSLTLDKWYHLTAAPSDLECGIAPLGPLAPTQPLLLGLWRGVAPLGCHPYPWIPGSSPWPPPLPRTWGSSSRLFLRCLSLALSAAAPDLGRGVTPLGRLLSGMGSTRLLPLTSDVGPLPTINGWVAAACGKK